MFISKNATYEREQSRKQLCNNQTTNNNNNNKKKKASLEGLWGAVGDVEHIIGPDKRLHLGDLHFASRLKDQHTCLVTNRSQILCGCSSDRVVLN